MCTSDNGRLVKVDRRLAASPAERTISTSVGGDPIAYCPDGEDWPELLLKRGARKRTDDPVDFAPVADHDQEWDRLGSEARSEPGIGVDVDLDDLQPFGVPAGKVLKHGRDHSARSAPRGPEVNDDGHRGARLGIEGRAFAPSSEDRGWASGVRSQQHSRLRTLPA